MPSFNFSCPIIVLFLLCGLCPNLFGGSEPNEVIDPWDVSITPYLWAAEIDGDGTLKGRTGSLKMSFSDIWDDLDVAFMGRIEAWKNKWGFFLDGTYMDVESDYDTAQGLVSADLEFEMSMLEFGTGYRLWETAAGKEGSQKLWFDLLGGGRYMNVNSTLDIVTNGPLSDIISSRTFDRRGEWVDPIIGGRLGWGLNEKLAIGIRSDIGGFGIGEASNLAWNFLAGVDWQLNKNMTLKVGYRLFDLDYENGSGNDEFGFDGQFRGPIAGLSISF